MIRAAAAVAAAVSLAVVSPATAARPLCNVVTDKAGDQALVTPGTEAYVHSDFDIRSADVAANLKHVVAVVRLASISRPTPQSPMGREIEVLFTVDHDRTFRLGGLVSMTEVTGWAYAYAGGVQPATISVDYDRGIVTLSAPANNFGTPPLRLREITKVTVETRQHVGLSPQTHTVGTFHSSGEAGAGPKADTATVEREYVAGAPTCVAMPR